MNKLFIALLFLLYPFFSAQAEGDISVYGVYGNWTGNERLQSAHTYVELFIKQEGDGWIPLNVEGNSNALENDDVERLMVSPTRKMIFTTFATDTKHQTVNGGSTKIVAGDIVSMRCASRMFPRSRGYYLCNSAFGNTDVAGAAVENSLYAVLTGGLYLLGGKAVYLVQTNHKKIIDAVSSPFVLDYLTQKERIQIESYFKSRNKEFHEASTEQQLAAFISKYGNENDDGLVTEASKKLKLLRYRNDYAKVSSNPTVDSLTGFIKLYSGFDPDTVIPPLVKQLDAEKAREAIASRQQQEQKTKLASALQSKLEIGDSICSDGAIKGPLGYEFKGVVYGFTEEFSRNKKRIKVRLKNYLGKAPIGLSGENWRLRNFEIIPDSIIWDDIVNWLPCDVSFN